ncbi:MAG: urea transporter [Bacteroidetes bacterium OLB11]|nr:MAG: urea transporter [Bacteroidetes bacterium OLB11]
MPKFYPFSKYSFLDFDFLKSVFTGIGQIMLQENGFTGVLFLVGLLYADFSFGVAAFVSSMLGTIVAHFLKAKKEIINSGHYGFNAALVGVAFIFYFKHSVFLWFYLLIGAILSTFIHHFFIIKKYNLFTLPFIIITWIALLCARYNLIFTLNIPPTPSLDTSFIVLFLKGFAQIIFQNNSIVGLLFLIGILFNSRIAAICSILAALISFIIYPFFNIDAALAFEGIFCFNAILSSFVFYKI